MATASVVLIPGSAHGASLNITVVPAGLACTAEVFLTIDGTTKAVDTTIAFTSTGAAQTLSISGISMPTVAGVYTVYIDIWNGSTLLAAFVATATVTIPGVGTPTITWS
jgi:hypothetical protein